MSKGVLFGLFGPLVGIVTFFAFVSLTEKVPSLAAIWTGLQSLLLASYVVGLIPASLTGLLLEAAKPLWAGSRRKAPIAFGIGAIGLMAFVEIAFGSRTLLRGEVFGTFTGSRIEVILQLALWGGSCGVLTTWAVDIFCAMLKRMSSSTQSAGAWHVPSDRP